MQTVTKQVWSQHSPKILYEVVNDTQSYHLFVPFCTGSDVVWEKDGQKECRLIFAKGPIARELITQNTLTPYDRIEISLVSGDFSHLQGLWEFVPDREGTMIKLYFEYAFSHILLEHTFGQVFGPLTQELIHVFSKRADECAI